MKAERAGRRPGLGRHARHAAALERRTRGACCGAWALGSLAVTGAAAGRHLARRGAAPRPTRPATSYPGITRPATAARLRLRAVPQRARARAALARLRRRASSPARRCRRSPRATRALAQGPRPRRAAGDRLRRRRDALLARHAGLRARRTAPPTSPPSCGISPLVLLLAPAPARAAGAVRALPAARRLDARQPPRRLERAARRDVRHDRRSRSRCCVLAASIETWVTPAPGARAGDLQPLAILSEATRDPARGPHGRAHHRRHRQQLPG